MSVERKFCTFWLNDLLFGIPVESIQEVMRCERLTVVPTASPNVSGLINLRGRIVTGIDLRHQLHFPPRAAGVECTSIVVHTPEELVALLVDGIAEVVSVDDSTFERTPETLSETSRDMIMGVHKLERGLLLLLDVDRAASSRTMVVA